MRVLSAHLLARVAEFLHLYSTRSRPLRLGVAVSGGADSVVLLHILKQLPANIVRHITVLHVNHQLRGFESQNDQLFVETLASSLGLPCLTHQGPPPPGNLEAQARRVRMEIFRQARLDRDLDFVALGHTASDQAETVLFRLLRGSGLTGLAGMKPASGGLIRPLLTTTRQELREYAQANQLEWREDSSNADLHFRRNRLRLAVIPELVRHFNPRLEQTLAASAGIAQAEEQYWAKKAARVLTRLSQPYLAGLLLDTRSLFRLPLALQRRVVRLAVQQVRGNLNSIDISHIEGILRIASSPAGHDRVQVPGIDALRSFDILLLTLPATLKSVRDYVLAVAPGEPVKLPFAAGTLTVNPVSSAGSICVTVKGERFNFAEEAELDGEAVVAASHGKMLRVRNWQPGDRILLSGMAHPEKLKTLFQENRVPLWERRHWPVLIADNNLVWTRRFGVAAEFAAPVTGRQRFRISYQPFRPAGKIGSESKDVGYTSFNM